jgi:hypothetical protein
MLNKYRRLVSVLWKLGFMNVLKFALYKFKMQCGYIRFCTPVGASPSGEVFHLSGVELDLPAPLIEHLVKSADQLRAGMLPFFSGSLRDVGVPPQWFQLGEKKDDGHWSDVIINDQIGSDVKLTWDLSRFQWAPTLAAAYSITSDSIYIESLNQWILDWWSQNPPNSGVNWVCAQEASIRMLNLLNSAHLLGQDNEPSEALIQFVQIHCARIAPTLQYSVSQANNHGISEAVALFVGGHWLNRVSNSKIEKSRALIHAKRGRKVLETLVSTLVSKDGSFSMYSLNYHRVVLDTLNLAEYWRKEMELDSFSPILLSRASLMVDYLFAFVDENSGDVPNFGTNDGSRSFLLTASEYRDYRPTVQLGARLFQQSSKFSSSDCNDSLAWMKLKTKSDQEKSQKRESSLFMDSGFVALIPKNSDSSWAAMRFPQYKFRPSHSDQLHFDLWHLGQNILCDSGTYSYNTDPILENYFVGSKGHNTIQFDGNESMPKIGRFLVGEWLQASKIADINGWNKKNVWSASYKDYRNIVHSRSIFYKNDTWTIIDKFQGHSEKAILRWHLGLLDWKKDGDGVRTSNIKIEISSDGEFRRLDLLKGKRSLFYSVVEDSPMLEVEVDISVTCITTKVHLG